MEPDNRMSLQILQDALAMVNPPPSISTTNRKEKVQTWLNNLPPHASDFDPHTTPPQPTIAIYQDLLLWTATTALRCLQALDKADTRFRFDGVRYHTIRLTNRRKVGSVALRYRFMDLFETDRGRDEQPFFADWKVAQQIALGVIERVRDLRVAEDVVVLKVAYEAHDEEVEALVKKNNKIVELVENVTGLVNEVCEQAPLEGATLGEQYSLEGNIFRRWIRTFSEFDGIGGIDVVGGVIDARAQAMLNDGVWYVDYWRGNAVEWMSE
ncbi:hypothetical protein P154DRAFT_237613 [Amniculicola lignicola CBS 123094]|uniref:Uncharacterized protein n=1 Tax=Amniculicola lignicola CBS 123094 TaxID=1392246 RepID=A0A6A5WAQ0_9PLEO|nr:hypothetical protein P154DRAFT_237613 [Amniculicola lignicola CBS 123094]